MKSLLAIMLMLATCAFAADPRYCGPPKRDASGRIVRSHAARAAFVMEVACPANGSNDVDAGCPGWALDHVWPLASCGCDAPVNMQWLPLTIKSCAGTQCKDRWERKVYVCRPEDR
jgi:hypothetical protein